MAILTARAHNIKCVFVHEECRPKLTVKLGQFLPCFSGINGAKYARAVVFGARPEKVVRSYIVAIGKDSYARGAYIPAASRGAVVDDNARHG